MNVKELSGAFTTDKIQETKAFYEKYFDARVIFDCGWYVNLAFGSGTATLQFMSPKEPDYQLSNSAGLMYNFKVDNVDQEYDQIRKRGLNSVSDIEDHPWGDRAFCAADPNGIILYIYSEREPAEEFKKYYKNPC